VGASIAFEAGLNKYTRNEYVLLMYHIHIPLPDPMVNPATLARQQFYNVRSSPSYVVDGEASGGGGPADSAKTLFESKIDPMITKHMAEAPEAAIELSAQAARSTVKVKTTVSKVTSSSDKLRLQIALVEGHVRYSGENGPASTTWWCEPWQFHRCRPEASLKQSSPPPILPAFRSPYSVLR
jgi:hypothetical protein